MSFNRMPILIPKLLHVLLSSLFAWRNALTCGPKIICVITTLTFIKLIVFFFLQSFAISHKKQDQETNTVAIIKTIMDKTCYINKKSQFDLTSEIYTLCVSVHMEKK